MNWLETDIMPAWNDASWSVISGSATIESDKITLPVNSVVRVSLTTGDIMTKASGIKLVTGFTGTFDSSENYMPHSIIGMTIKYLDNTYQNVKLTFSRHTAVDSVFIDTSEIETESKTVSSCDIYFKNMDSALGTLYIYTRQLYKSEDVNSAQVENIVTTQVKISSVPTYTNGIIVKIVDGNSIYFKEIYNTAETELIGLLVNEKDYIQMPHTDGELPAIPT